MGARGPGVQVPGARGVRGPEQEGPPTPEGPRAGGPGDAAPPRGGAREGRDPCDGERPAQAPLVDPPEDHEARAGRTRRSTTSWPCASHGHGPELLRGAGRDPQPLGADPRAIPRLRGDAEVEHVPLAPHDGLRARRAPLRDPDPHGGDAPHGGVRHRGALALQGGGIGTTLGGRGRRGAHLVPPGPGVAEGHERAGGVHGVPPDGPLPRRDLRLHAGGGREGAPAGIDADRLRLRRAHGDRVSLCGRSHQRPHRAALSRAQERRRGRDPDEPEAAAEPRLAGVRAHVARPPVHSSVDPARGVRAALKLGKDLLERELKTARRALPSDADALREGALALGYPDFDRVTRRSAGATSDPPRSSGSSTPITIPKRSPDGSPRRSRSSRRSSASRAAACGSRGWTTSWYATPAAASRCPATT
jgi:hypothetical protein